MSQSTIELTAEQANQMREQCNKQIAIGQALHNLQMNIDFKLVFEKEYSLEEPSRLTKLLADPTINMGGKKQDYRDDIQERLIGIARFNEYIRNVHRLSDQAKKTLEDLNKAEISE